jgi:hypothetical protein
VGVELGKLRVNGEEILVWVEADVPIGNHEAFESLEPPFMTIHSL